MRRLTFRRAVAVAMLLTTVAAACGSDDDAATTTAAAATTTPAAATTTAASGSTTAAATTTAAGPTTTAKPKPASGAPIKIGYITTESASTNTINGRFGAQAAVDYINAELGGLHGRPIALDTCAVLGTPESSVSCSNQLVDKKPVVVYAQSDNGKVAGLPIIVASGIPYFTPSGAGVPETSTKGAFNNSPGSIAIWVSLAKFAADQKMDRIGVLGFNVAAVTGSFEKYGKPAFDKLGVQVNFAPFDPAAADLSPQMQTASQGAKMVFVLGLPASCVAGAKARDALGLTIPFIVPALCWDDATRTSFGSQLKGTYLISDESTPLADDPDVITFTAAMAKYSPSTKVDGVTATGFQGMVNLYRVLKQIPASSEFTAATAMAAFNATKDLPLFMKHGGKATCDGNQIAGLVSVCNAGYWVGQYDGTKVKVLSDYDVPKVLKELGL